MPARNHETLADQGIRTPIRPNCEDQLVEPLRPIDSIMPEFSVFSALCEKFGSTPAEAHEVYLKIASSKVYRNDVYTVWRREDARGVTHLAIRRNDRAAARDWRHFQTIKNQLCGEEREAAELYPTEQRVVDLANVFHLWVMPAGFIFPMGFGAGLKRYETDESFARVQRGLMEELG